MVLLDRNMLSFLNKMNVVMFDGNITMCFKFLNTRGCPLQTKMWPQLSSKQAYASNYIVVFSLFGCAVLFHTISYLPRFS
jgi:hypothetical protein